jgi:hypothetical protein
VKQFPHLLQPRRIGSMTLRNRLVMSPMETMYGTPDGLPSERTRDYFAARAKGGVGLITVGATGIDHHHPETPGGLHLGTDAAVDAHRALVDVVHEHGAKIQPQIVHAGPDGLGPELHGVTSIGPSVIPSYLTGKPSAEVTHEQLVEVFDLFKAAVRRAAEAGYDGIELHAAHGYMFLTQTDVDIIGHLCAGMRRSTRVTASLSTGTTTIDVTALDDAAGVVAALRPAPRSTLPHGRPSPTGLVGQSKSWRAAAHHVSRHIAARQALIVAGEPGSGKTSLALGRPYVPGADVDGAVVVHAAERQISGDRAWLQRLADAMGTPTPVIIRGVETLDGPAVAALRTLIENTTGQGPVLLTMAASSHLESEAFAARLGIATVWVPPLRERAVDVAILWNAFAAQRAPGLRLELTDDARRAAEAHSWPGNLTELRGVVEQLVASGKRGSVSLDDLPDAMRGHRAWSMIERTEIQAIRRALQEAGGNRSRAAELLGISRATIHRKLKTYHISG